MIGLSEDARAEAPLPCWGSGIVSSVDLDGAGRTAPRMPTEVGMSFEDDERGEGVEKVVFYRDGCPRVDRNVSIFVGTSRVSVFVV